MPNAKDARERQIDEALEQSFPASDPPFFVGAGSYPDKPIKKRKERGDWGQNFGILPWDC